jgi:hypothetical protein
VKYNKQRAHVGAGVEGWESSTPPGGWRREEGDVSVSHQNNKILTNQATAVNLILSGMQQN